MVKFPGYFEDCPANLKAGRILILEKLDLPAKGESDWKNWYINERLNNYLHVTGFLFGRFFIKMNGIPKNLEMKDEAGYLALYDLSDARVLTSKPYVSLLENERGFDKSEPLKLTRGIYSQLYPQGDYEQPSNTFMFIVGHAVPRQKQKEYHVWYNTDKHPVMHRVPGILGIRRFQLLEKKYPPLFGSRGALPPFITVYDIASKDVIDSAAFYEASQSPWSTWVRSWFTRKMCAIYQRIYPEA